MINYAPFWEILNKKHVTKYQLIYHWGLSSNTLRRMSHGEAISTTTLNELCLILNCKVQDIISFEASDEELEIVNNRRNEISSFRKRKHKNKPQS